MRYAIRWTEGAKAELAALRRSVGRRIYDAVGDQLSAEPLTETRHRKRLENFVPTWVSAQLVWQLAVGDYRIHYDVDGSTVTIRAVRLKGRKTTEEIT